MLRLSLHGFVAVMLRKRRLQSRSDHFIESVSVSRSSRTNGGAADLRTCGRLAASGGNPDETNELHAST